MHRPPATFQVDGTAIRTRRMALGMTQDDCAARAAISRPYLSQLETGHRDSVRPPTYLRLRTVLDVPDDDDRLLAPATAAAREETHARREGSPQQEEGL
ncbi:helix-turn-helix domain-containing protein [Streptomyces alboflavus]|uniref:helix-turn-helix domain-containing protein n=1 Tax=Streptomyces alboflavus TaxID=67267 RepID=UPI0007C51BB6|nr:helix-turn-helix domain-containing protein [Streptomyces alboflavus]